MFSPIFSRFSLRFSASRAFSGLAKKFPARPPRKIKKIGKLDKLDKIDIEALEDEEDERKPGTLIRELFPADAPFIRSPEGAELYQPWSEEKRKAVEEKLRNFKYEGSESSWRWDFFPVENSEPRALSLAILGTPNSGKSALLNRLVGQKISAVSPKRNTTREAIKGVVHHKNIEIVIFDTPGVLGSAKEREGFEGGAQLNREAWAAGGSVDTIIIIIDAAKRLGHGELTLLKHVKSLKDRSPALQLVLLFNKVDLVHPKAKLLTLTQAVTALCPAFNEVFFVSVTEDDGISMFEEFLRAQAKPRPWQFQKAEVSEQTRPERVEELIREKIYQRINKEIPYLVEQNILDWKEDDERITLNHQLVVETPHQKAILIGSGGSTVRWILDRAKPEMEKILGKKVSITMAVTSKKK